MYIFFVESLCWYIIDMKWYHNSEFDKISDISDMRVREKFELVNNRINQLKMKINTDGRSRKLNFHRQIIIFKPIFMGDFPIRPS